MLLLHLTSRYADTEARGGVLEPSGITAIKFRTNDLRAAAHRMDPELIKFDTQLKAAEEASGEDAARIRAQINLRERHLLGLYTQMSQSFADLHDRPGRMLAKGVVRKVVPWAESRRFFYWRLRRRRAMFALRSRLIEAVPSLNQEAVRSHAVLCWLPTSVAPTTVCRALGTPLPTLTCACTMMDCFASG